MDPVGEGAFFKRRKMDAMSTTVVKSLQVIEILAQNGGPMGITDIARALELNQSAVQRILGTLSQRGYISRPNGMRKYQLTLSLWELGSQVVEQHQERRLLHPILRNLAQSTGLTVFLTQHCFPSILYLDKVEGAHGRIYSSEPGRRVAMARTAGGRVIMAYLSSGQLEELLAGSSDGMAQDIAELNAEMQAIRIRGFSITRGSVTPGVNSVACPIWSSDIVPFGSIALSADECHLGPENFDEIGKKLMIAAKEATIAMGGQRHRQEAIEAMINEGSPI